MAKEREKVQRRVFMEFTINSGLFYHNPDEHEGLRDALEAQIGDENMNLPDELIVWIPVAEGEGGPRQIIEEVARTPGRFHAVAVRSIAGKKMSPPPDRQLVMEDLD